MVGRVIEPGERRAGETGEVADTLSEAGVEPIMTLAASRRQQWGAGLRLLEHFDGRLPENYRELLRAIADLPEQRDGREPR
jgi:hypothetical protein